MISLQGDAKVTVQLLCVRDTSKAMEYTLLQGHVTPQLIQPLTTETSFVMKPTQNQQSFGSLNKWVRVT